MPRRRTGKDSDKRRDIRRKIHKHHLEFDKREYDDQTSALKGLDFILTNPKIVDRETLGIYECPQCGKWFIGRLLSEAFVERAAWSRRANLPITT